jgi:DNA-binding CsgD family transcriptional regulator
MPAKKYSDNLIETVAMLRENGLTYPAIAKRTGMHHASVKSYCLKLGADSPTSHCNGPRRAKPVITQRGGFTIRQFTPAEDAQLLALEAAGKTPAEIANIMGRARNSIVGRMMTIARRQERAESLADA